MNIMDELRKKQKFRQRLYSKTTLFILLFVAIFLVNPTWKIWRKNVENKEKLEASKVELAQLEKKEKELQAEVELLQSTQGKEQEIRKKFSVTKDGEEVVFIVDRNTSTSSTEMEVERGFWGGIWHWFAELFS